MYSEKITDTAQALLEGILTAIGIDGSPCSQSMEKYTSIKDALKVPEYITLPHHILVHLEAVLEEKLGVNTGGTITPNRDIIPSYGGVVSINPQATTFDSPCGRRNDNSHLRPHDILPKLKITIKAKKMGSGNFGGIPDTTYSVYHPVLEVGCLLNDIIELCNEILGHNQIVGDFSTFGVINSPFVKMSYLLACLASKGITFELNGSNVK